MLIQFFGTLGAYLIIIRNEIMEAGRYIEAPIHIKKSVCAELGIGESTLHHALRYSRDGEQSRLARERVLASGEAKIMRYIPENEAILCVGGVMRQYFDNGYLLVVDMVTGRYSAYAEGEEVEGEENMSGKLSTVRSLLEVQGIVGGLSR